MTQRSRSVVYVDRGAVVACRLTARRTIVRVTAEPHGRMEPQERNVREFSHLGGAIKFSSTINVDVDTLRGKIEAKIKSWVAHHGRRKRVQQVVVEVSRQSEKKDKGIGYTLGPTSEGQYVDEGTVYPGEVAYKVELDGLDTETLEKVAEGIRKSFSQKGVIVNDYNLGKSYEWMGFKSKDPAASRRRSHRNIDSPYYTRDDVSRILRR